VRRALAEDVGSGDIPQRDSRDVGTPPFCPWPPLVRYCMGDEVIRQVDTDDQGAVDVQGGAEPAARPDFCKMSGPRALC